MQEEESVMTLHATAADWTNHHHHHLDASVHHALQETLEEVGEEGSDMNILAVTLSNVFLFFLIFGLSATVSISHLKKQLHNKFALLTGVGMQFVIMPLLGFATVMILKQGDDGFTQAMGMTLLVVTSSPGGSYSNWWCSLFNADLALSVAMTAVSTMLSIGMLPANLVLYSHLAYGSSMDEDNDIVAAIDFGMLFVSLGVVMGAILLGLYASYKTANVTFQRWANRGASLSGVALIVVSALLSSVGTETNFWNQHWKFYVGVAMPCLIGLSVANIISRSLRLPRPECVAISIECCYQNTGIATSIAVTMFTDPEDRAQALAVPLFYGAVEAFVIMIYCIWAWKAGWTKAASKDSICKVIGKSYEVDELEHELEDAARAAEAHSARSVVVEGDDGPDTPGKQDRSPTRSKDDDLEDLPRILEEEAPHPKRWYQFWKKKKKPVVVIDEFDEIGLRDEASPSKYGYARSRLTSEDNTVATGITDRPRLASDDNLLPDSPPNQRQKLRKGKR